MIEPPPTPTAYKKQKLIFSASLRAIFSFSYAAPPEMNIFAEPFLFIYRVSRIFRLFSISEGPGQTATPPG
jgi:hypothetical protein